VKPKRQKEPLTLREIADTVAALQTVFKDVVVIEKNGRSVIVAREHFAMLRRVSCFCGGERVPSSVAGYKEYHKQKETYSTGEGA